MTNTHLHGESGPTSRFRLTAEALGLVAGFAFFVQLLTSPPVIWERLCPALALPLLGIVLALSPWTRKAPDRGRLLLALSGLAAGCWLFSVFRLAAFVAWPMARPQNLGDYAYLGYSHFVFALTMMAAVLWALYGASRIGEQADPHPRVFRWGAWRGRHGFSPSAVLLILTAVAPWIWALTHAASHPLHRLQAHGLTLLAFASLALAKACLTGVTEEVCYRGLIQSLAINRYGAPMGVVFQSILYAVFHMHLGPAIVPPSFFLVGLFAFGLVLGTVTHRTRGIGWACAVHIALDVVVEWGNLS